MARCIYDIGNNTFICEPPLKNVYKPLLPQSPDVISWMRSLSFSVPLKFPPFSAYSIPNSFFQETCDEGYMFCKADDGAGPGSDELSQPGCLPSAGASASAEDTLKCATLSIEMCATDLDLRCEWKEGVGVTTVRPDGITTALFDIVDDTENSICDYGSGSCCASKGDITVCMPKRTNGCLNTLQLSKTSVCPDSLYPPEEEVCVYGIDSDKPLACYPKDGDADCHLSLEFKACEGSYSCMELEDESKCRSSENCVWTRDEDEGECVSNTATSPSTCTGLMQQDCDAGPCTWKQQFRCIEEGGPGCPDLNGCKDRTIDSCEKDDSCVWQEVDNSCHPSVCSFDDTGEEDELKLEDCVLNADKEACDMDASCTWMNDACENIGDEGEGNEGTTDATSTSAPSATGIVGFLCGDFDTEEKCDAEVMCEWEASRNSCHDGEAPCPSENCDDTKFRCKEATNQSSCFKKNGDGVHLKCDWSDLNKCLPLCRDGCDDITPFGVLGDESTTPWQTSTNTETTTSSTSSSSSSSSSLTSSAALFTSSITTSSRVSTRNIKTTQSRGGVDTSSTVTIKSSTTQWPKQPTVSTRAHLHSTNTAPNPTALSPSYSTQPRSTTKPSDSQITTVEDDPSIAVPMVILVLCALGLVGYYYYNKRRGFSGVSDGFLLDDAEQTVFDNPAYSRVGAGYYED